MERGPRNHKEKLLTAHTLFKSIIQGLIVFASSYGIYYYFLLKHPGNASLARSMGLAVIMLANLFLVQVNSSECDYAAQSFKQLVKDKVMWGANIGSIALLLLVLYSPINAFLKLSPLNGVQLLIASVIAATSVLWYEVVKMIKKAKKV
jgi:P-type Ca2+ transporter type 2C